MVDMNLPLLCVLPVNGQVFKGDGLWFSWRNTSWVINHGLSIHLRRDVYNSILYDMIWYNNNDNNNNNYNDNNNIMCSTLLWNPAKVDRWPNKSCVFLMAFKITIHVEKTGRLTLNLPPMGWTKSTVVFVEDIQPRDRFWTVASSS